MGIILRTRGTVGCAQKGVHIADSRARANDTACCELGQTGAPVDATCKAADAPEKRLQCRADRTQTSVGNANHRSAKRLRKPNQRPTKSEAKCLSKAPGVGPWFALGCRFITRLNHLWIPRRTTGNGPEMAQEMLPKKCARKWPRKWPRNKPSNPGKHRAGEVGVVADVGAEQHCALDPGDTSRAPQAGTKNEQAERQKPHAECIAM